MSEMMSCCFKRITVVALLRINFREGMGWRLLQQSRQAMIVTWTRIAAGDTVWIRTLDIFSEPEGFPDVLDVWWAGKDILLLFLFPFYDELVWQGRGCLPCLRVGLGGWIKKDVPGPGWVAQLVGMLSGCIKVVGPIPSQDTFKNQPMNAWIGGTTN